MSSTAIEDLSLVASPLPSTNTFPSKSQTSSPKDATEKTETRETRSSSMSRRSSGSRKRNSLVPYFEPIKAPYLYVSQLRPDAPIGKLIPLLQEKGGPIIANHFLENQTFGFVHFSSTEAVSAAVQALHGTTFHGHPIHLEPCERITPGIELVRVNPSSANPQSSQPSSLRIEKPSKKDGAKAEDTETRQLEEKVEKSNSLFVRNFPAKTQEELLRFMAEKGVHPLEVSLHFTTDGRANGFAFAMFSSIDEASLAFNVLDKCPYGNRKIKVEWKRPSAQHSKSPGNDERAHGNQIIMDKLSAFSASSESKLELPDVPKSQHRAFIDAATKLGLSHQLKGDGQSRVLTISKPNATPEPSGSRPLVATITTTLMDGQVSITSHVVIKTVDGKQDSTISPPANASTISLQTSQTSQAPPSKPLRLTESRPPQTLYSPSRAPKGPDGSKGFTHFPRTKATSD